MVGRPFLTKVLGALCLLVLVSNVSFAKAQTINQADRIEYPCLMVPSPAMSRDRHGYTFGVKTFYNDSHRGFDWATGGKVVPVFAAYSGTITRKYDTYDEELWRAGGKLVWRLDPPFQDFVLMYFHLDYMDPVFMALQEGEHIEKGQEIALLAPNEKDPNLGYPRMGKYSSAPHLHQQLEYKGILIDPLPLTHEDCGQPTIIRMVEIGELRPMMNIPDDYIDPLMGPKTTEEFTETNTEVTTTQPEKLSGTTTISIKNPFADNILNININWDEIKSAVPVKINWDKLWENKLLVLLVAAILYVLIVNNPQNHNQKED